MSHKLFEDYRDYYSKQYPSYICNEGEVVFRAADWHQFIDPESRIALVSMDLENLGVRPDFTRQKIVQCLVNVLGSKQAPYLLQWTRNYIMAHEQDDDVASLEQVKIQAFKSARKAIEQVIEFCHQDPPAPEPEKPRSFYERILHWFAGESKGKK